MADANPQVMEMIEAELKQNPDTSNSELLEKAKEIDPGVGELTARQFNATYPLQVKRALKPSKPARRKSKKPAARRARRGGANADGRDRIRGILLDLARAVAGAEGKGDVVDVIAGIDQYVDRVEKVAK